MSRSGPCKKGPLLRSIAKGDRLGRKAMSRLDAPQRESRPTAVACKLILFVVQSRIINAATDFMNERDTNSSVGSH